MRTLFIGLLLMVGLPARAADCPTAPPTGPSLPLTLDLAQRPGVPKGVTGQAYIDVPFSAPGMACADTPPPPRDILRGEPGDVLRGPPSPDLLRGPGTPRVWVESR